MLLCLNEWEGRTSDLKNLLTCNNPPSQKIFYLYSLFTWLYFGLSTAAANELKGKSAVF
jgi:hypothetical protein